MGIGNRSGCDSQYSLFMSKSCGGMYSMIRLFLLSWEDRLLNILLILALIRLLIHDAKEIFKNDLFKPTIHNLT